MRPVGNNWTIDSEVHFDRSQDALMWHHGDNALRYGQSSDFIFLSAGGPLRQPLRAGAFAIASTELGTPTASRHRLCDAHPSGLQPLHQPLPFAHSLASAGDATAPTVRLSRVAAGRSRRCDRTAALDERSSSRSACLSGRHGGHEPQRRGRSRMRPESHRYRPVTRVEAAGERRRGRTRYGIRAIGQTSSDYLSYAVSCGR